MRELYQIFPSAFTDIQINKILDIVSNQSLLNASTFSSKIPSEDIRKSKICWLSEDWIKNLLWEYILKVNNKSFKINVENNSEVQFTEYCSEDNGHYDWHQDIGPGELSIRKVSVTIQLSDSNDYEGGDLELLRGATPEQTIRGKGVAVLFPSYMLHRVTPITRGTRRSLVLWLGGSHFK